jgi:hypothetical protein
VDSYWNNWGMLNARSEDPANFNENSALFTAEYILKKDDPNLPECFAFVKFLAETKISKGLYNQLPRFAGNNDDYVSHDQLSSWMLMSKKYNMGIHNDIWAEVKRQGFRYNNITPDSPGLKGLLHPRDIIQYGMIAGSKLWYLLWPLWFLMIVWSQFGQETSGKCLNWLRCQGMGWNWTLKVLEWLMPYKDWSSVFAVYFPDPNHPINIAFGE